MAADSLGIRRFGVSLVLLIGVFAAGPAHAHKLYVAGVDRGGDVVVTSSQLEPQYRIDRAAITPVTKIRIKNVSGATMIVATYSSNDSVLLVPATRSEVKHNTTLEVKWPHIHVKLFRQPKFPEPFDVHLATHKDVKSDVTIKDKSGNISRAAEPAPFRVTNNTGRTIKVCVYKPNDTVRLIPFNTWSIDPLKSVTWPNPLTDFHVRVFHPLLLDKPMTTLENVSRWSTLTVNPVFQWSPWEKLTDHHGCRPALTAHGRSDGSILPMLCVVRTDGTPQWTILRDGKWGAWKSLPEPTRKVGAPVVLCQQTVRAGVSWVGIVTANWRGDDGRWRTEQADPPRSSVAALVQANGPADQAITHQPCVASWYRNLMSAYRKEDGSVWARFLETQNYGAAATFTFKDTKIVTHDWGQVGAGVLGTPSLTATATSWDEWDNQIPYRLDLLVLTADRKLGHKSWVGPLNGKFENTGDWLRPVSQGELESPPSAASSFSSDQAKSPHSIVVVAQRQGGVHITFGTCTDVKNSLTWYPGWLALPKSDLQSSPVLLIQ